MEVRVRWGVRRTAHLRARVFPFSWSVVLLSFLQRYLSIFLHLSLIESDL
jgi:hypothetical protein